MKKPASASQQTDPAKPTTHGWFVAIALVLTALCLRSDPWPFVNPVPAATVVPEWVTEVTTVRHPTLVPEITISGFTYRCGACHDLFPSPPETTRTLTQHQHITLKHGINTRCLNCHHLTTREAFVDDAGGLIPYDQPELLCARCHGPVYRDWLHGVHGRTNKYWDTSKGPQERRKCIECHDPHQPPFPPMAPAPPPNTLRMGDQQIPVDHGDIADPLRIYHHADKGPDRGRPGSLGIDAESSVGGENRPSGEAD